MAFDRKKFDRDRKRRRRHAWIMENGPCWECQSWDDLQVDHIDPWQKKYQITNIWNMKKEIREEELSRCQVLCMHCHYKKTRRQDRSAIQGKIYYAKGNS